MAHQEYLVRYGKLGDFGRFYAVRPPAVPWGRGQRVVVRGHRGVEPGVVLGPARAGHAAFLPNTSVGEVLRAWGPPEDAAWAEREHWAGAVCREAQTLAAELVPGLAVLDVELMLEGDEGVVHVLGEAAAGLGPWLQAVAARCGVRLSAETVTAAGADQDAEEYSAAGCDRPDCGAGACAAEGQGCATCALPALFKGHHP